MTHNAELSPGDFLLCYRNYNDWQVRRYRFTYVILLVRKLLSEKNAYVARRLCKHGNIILVSPHEETITGEVFSYSKTIEELRRSAHQFNGRVENVERWEKINFPMAIILTTLADQVYDWDFIRKIQEEESCLKPWTSEIAY